MRNRTLSAHKRDINYYEQRLERLGKLAQTNHWGARELTSFEEKNDREYMKLLQFIHQTEQMKTEESDSR